MYTFVELPTIYFSTRNDKCNVVGMSSKRRVGSVHYVVFTSFIIRWDSLIHTLNSKVSYPIKESKLSAILSFDEIFYFFFLEWQKKSLKLRRVALSYGGAFFVEAEIKPDGRSAYKVNHFGAPGVKFWWRNSHVCRDHFPQSRSCASLNISIAEPAQGSFDPRPLKLPMHASKTADYEPRMKFLRPAPQHWIRVDS